MVAKIKRTIPYLEHAIAEYQATSQPLGDMLTGSFTNSVNLIERMVISLERYLELNAPSAPKLPPEGTAGASGATTTQAKSTASTGDSSTAPVAGSTPAATEETPAETAKTEEGAVS